MAMEVEVQRLQLGDVVVVTPNGEEAEAEATVTREIDRTESTVRVTLRVAGRDDFVEEWPLGALVTVVRGP
jgi:hypothetical protein